jgi:hypothetical protein
VWARAWMSLIIHHWVLKGWMSRILPCSNLGSNNDFLRAVLWPIPWGSRLQWPRGLRHGGSATLVSWDCGFESLRRHGCLPLVLSCHSCRIVLLSVVYLRVIVKPITRRPWPTRGCCGLGGGGDTGRNSTKNVLNANRLASRSSLHLYSNSQL